MPKWIFQKTSGDQQGVRPINLHFLFKGAKFNAATNLWIGVSDVGTEDEFAYLSDWSTLIARALQEGQCSRVDCNSNLLQGTSFTFQGSYIVGTP